MNPGHPLIFVPIEPLAERYTESWYRNFPRHFQNAGFKVSTVAGQPLCDTVRVGTFLDINSTVHYKMAQLQHIAWLFQHGEVEPDTVFFFGDVEFWGLESVRLMSQLNRVPVKMCGFLHAASYTYEDAFSVASPYQQFTEVGWLAALDEVYVGSAYHRDAVIERRLVPQHAEHFKHRILNTGNPLFMDDYLPFATQKKRKVLLTNRFDKEKRPNETLVLFHRLKERFPHWEFVVTTGRKNLTSDPSLLAFARGEEEGGVIEIKTGLTKAEYHHELAEAAIVVSHSIEENYGYCIAEALIYKALPLLREGMSHNEFLRGRPELLFNNFRYGNSDDFNKAAMVMDAFGTEAWPAVPELDTTGTQNIIRAVKALAVREVEW